MGVALVDIGGGTTDIALFERGSIVHTTVLPTGGEHFTNDIAIGLRTPIPEAEKILVLVQDEIKRTGYDRSIAAGLVLTGGGSILEGIPEIAEQIFDLPVRRAAPSGIGG